mmetsp:Transcript_23096/g.75186  ORF Transcript_23096/g.75186 Transcript_23096/m.75186 type:complete len:203 (-) Transcript_23096:1041-1649(-)
MMVTLRCLSFSSFCQVWEEVSACSHSSRSFMVSKSRKDLLSFSITISMLFPALFLSQGAILTTSRSHSSTGFFPLVNSRSLPYPIRLLSTSARYLDSHIFIFLMPQVACRIANPYLVNGLCFRESSLSTLGTPCTKNRCTSTSSGVQKSWAMNAYSLYSTFSPKLVSLMLASFPSLQGTIESPSPWHTSVGVRREVGESVSP